MDVKQKVPAITLLGQAASGKTNLLTAFLNHQASWLDLQTGPDAVAYASFAAEYVSGGEEERAFDYLRNHYVAMLKGREFKLEGTNAARRYNVKYSFTDKPLNAEPEVEKSKWWQKSRTAAAPIAMRGSFQIIDGRGADAAPSEIITSEDKDAIARRQDYREGMDDSVGFVIFMPLMSTDEGSEAMIAARFLSELQEAIKRKASRPTELPKLKNVALCFTKCEQAFSIYDVDGEVEARDMANYRQILHGNALLSNFRSIIAESLSPEEYNLRVFPVSTYGFVHPTGQSNFYPWEEAPGVLTRAVDAIDDFENPDLPDFKDHFPFPLTDDQARTMWRPFNIAPPLLYALTGRITGPRSIAAIDALDMAGG